MSLGGECLDPGRVGRHRMNDTDHGRLQLLALPLASVTLQHLSSSAATAGEHIPAQLETALSSSSLRTPGLKSTTRRLLLKCHLTTPAVSCSCSAEQAGAGSDTWLWAGQCGPRASAKPPRPSRAPLAQPGEEP